MTVPRALLVLVGFAIPPAASAAQAVTVGDDSFHLNISAELQFRAEHATAKDPAGGDWDVALARHGRSDEFAFSLPRARLGINGTYGPGYRFAVVVRADAVDAAGNQTSRGLDLYKAWVDRDFADGTLVNTVHLGLDQPFFNRSQTITPYWLFPQQRATGALLAPRGVGARYKLGGEGFDLGFDIMNGLDGAKPAANADKSNGLFYSARLELAPLDGPKPAYRESWAGDPGEGILLALDVGYDNDDYATAGVKTDSVCYGIEGLGHFDEFSCLAEVRFAHSTQSSFTGGAGATLNQQVFVAQAGWAIVIDRGLALEPAVRLELIDLDTGNGSEAVAYDGGAHNPGLDSDWGDSGRQVDLGLNLYLARHTNKLQFSYSHWDAESGDGKADILRLQYQLYF